MAARGYESGGEYIRALIRERQASQTLRGILLEGAVSGPGELADDAYFQSRRDRVRATRTASTRYAHQLDLRGLRFRMVKVFPYLVVYAEQEDRIEGWRVLPAQRDIPREIEDFPD